MTSVSRLSRDHQVSLDMPREEVLSRLLIARSVLNPPEDRESAHRSLPFGGCRISSRLFPRAERLQGPPPSPHSEDLLFEPCALLCEAPFADLRRARNRPDPAGETDDPDFPCLTLGKICWPQRAEAAALRDGATKAAPSGARPKHRCSALSTLAITRFALRGQGLFL
jgi:hypothetical protein